MERAKSECICGSRRHNSKWIICDCCKQWYHLACGRVGEEEFDRIAKFICFKCTKRDGELLTVYRCNECAGCMRQHDCGCCEACEEADPKRKCFRKYCALEKSGLSFTHEQRSPTAPSSVRPHKKRGRKKKEIDIAVIPRTPKKRGRKKKNPDVNVAVNDNMPILLQEKMPVLQPENYIPSEPVADILPRSIPSETMPVIHSEDIPYIPPEFPRAKRSADFKSYFSSESSSSEEEEAPLPKRGRKKKEIDISDVPRTPKKRGRKKKNPDAIIAVNNNIPILLQEKMPVLQPENYIPSEPVADMLPTNIPSEAVPVLHSEDMPYVPPEFPRAKRIIDFKSYFSSESSSNEEEEPPSPIPSEPVADMLSRNIPSEAMPYIPPEFPRAKRMIDFKSYFSSESSSSEEEEEAPLPKRTYKKRGRKKKAQSDNVRIDAKKCIACEDYARSNSDYCSNNCWFNQQMSHIISTEVTLDSHSHRLNAANEN